MALWTVIRRFIVRQDGGWGPRHTRKSVLGSRGRGMVALWWRRPRLLALPVDANRCGVVRTDSVARIVGPIVLFLIIPILGRF